MKTIATTTYVIGDRHHIETSEHPPVHTGPAGWGHRERPDLRFLAGEDGFLVPAYHAEAVIRIADEPLLQELAVVDQEIAEAQRVLKDLKRKRQQILRENVARCARVPVPGILGASADCEGT